jgi:hypothetical protein
METELYWPAEELGEEVGLVRGFRGKQWWSVKQPLGYCRRKDTEKYSREKKGLKYEKKLRKGKKGKLEKFPGSCSSSFFFSLSSESISISSTFLALPSV